LRKRREIESKNKKQKKRDSNLFVCMFRLLEYVGVKIHEEKNGEPREKNLRKKKKEKQRKRNERV
jgi:hypothetical protein